VRAARARLGRGHGEKRFHQFGIERGGEPDGLREAGAADGGVAVQALFVKDHRDAQAAMFQKELLDVVGEHRHGAGGAVIGGIARAAGIAGAAHLAQAAAVPEGLFGFGGGRNCLCRRPGFRPSSARRTSSARLFPRAGHARQQVLDAFAGGRRGIAIGWEPCWSGTKASPITPTTTNRWPIPSPTFPMF
jgi:hypothetical protein